MIVGSIWSVLGLAATRDASAIRRAYAARLKVVNPEDDAEGFQKLRAAYEQAMALARAKVPLAADGDDAEDERPEPVLEPSVFEERLPEPPRAAPPEPEPPRPAPPEQPGGDYDRLWSRLESLVSAGETPPEFELADALEALLRHRRLEDVGEHMSAESRLAHLIARGFPRTDPLIQPAAERFGWVEAAQERYPNPTVVRVVRRGVEAQHLKALAALEALARQPTPPLTFELDRALNDVTTTALNDPEIFRHTEAELVRMILAYAPRLDDLIATIAGRLSWDRRGYDDVVGPVLRRRDTIAARRRLEARSHELHEAWELIHRPPSAFEPLRQLVAPRRHGRIRKLMASLQSSYPDIWATLPRDATAAWGRYFRVAILNPFAVGVLVVLALLVTTCQMGLARQRAADVARYYPAEALKAGMNGTVTLRCRAYDESTLHDCKVIAEDPLNHGFGQAALRISHDGRLRAEAGDADQAWALYDARVLFTSSPGGRRAGIILDYGRRADRDQALQAPPDVSPGFVEVSGTVTLRCLRGGGDKLSQCSAVAEDPAGQGLGDYAVIYAEDGVIKPPPALRPDAQGWIQFQAPVRIEKAATPTTLAPRATVAPQLAERSGSAILECRRTPNDHLSACHALWESPRGQGVGAQAAAQSEQGRIHVLSPPPARPQIVRFNVRLGPHPPPIPLDALGRLDDPGPQQVDAPRLRAPPVVELKPIEPGKPFDGPSPSTTGPDQVPQWVRDARKAEGGADKP